jgi:hypothetical protein
MATTKRSAAKKTGGSSRKLALKKETLKDLSVGARGRAAKGGTYVMVSSKPYSGGLSGSVPLPPPPVSYGSTSYSG